MSVKIARGRDSAGGHRTRLLLSRFFSPAHRSSADGLSQRLRRLLYRAVNIQPDPRHAERQARQYPLHSRMNGCAAACFIRRCGRKCAAACSRAATCATITAIRR